MHSADGNLGGKVTLFGCFMLYLSLSLWCVCLCLSVSVSVCLSFIDVIILYT